MLVTGLEILRKARAEGYGVGAFNTNNMEFTQAILEAAEEMKSPVILALSEGAMKYGGRALTRMVVALAQSLNLSVIAEGVEHPAQRDCLAHLGCYQYQGYLFGRPMPADLLESSLQPTPET